MKKLIYLLPIALLAASCNNNDPFTPVENPAEEIPTRIVAGLDSMYKSVPNGIGLELSVEVPTFTFSEYETDLQGANKVEGMNVAVENLKAKLAVEVEPGATAKDIKAHVGLKDVGGKVAVKEEGKEIFSVDVSGLDLNAYLVGTKIYADTTDAELVSAAKTIIGLVTGIEDVATIEQYVTPFVGKFFVEGLIDEQIEEISGYIPRGEIEGIPAEVQTEVKTAIGGVLGALEQDESLKNVFQFFVDEKAGYKVAAEISAADFAKLVGDVEEEDEFTGKLTASVESDEQGRITKVAAGIDMTVKSAYTWTQGIDYTDVVVKASASLAVKYGVSVSTPDFSSYVAFPMEVISGLLG